YEAMLAGDMETRPELVEHDVTSVAEAEAAATWMLALEAPPTAFFAAQNLVTIGTLRALRRAGLSQEIAVVGFDDFLLADLLEPGITVVAQDVNLIGIEAAELLFRRIAGEEGPPEHVVTQPTLVERGSGEINPR
ncbi:MAG: substrate-binding domain-containing protein, partial [Actinomycetes bacterium]